MSKGPQTVSLVLGSGGARGLAHIGIINWLEEHNYKIISVSGSSMGALVGGIYALGKLDEYEQPKYDPDALDRRIARSRFALDLDAFLTAEGAVGWARMAYRDGKLVHGAGYTHRVGATPKLPGVEIAAEDYRRLARLAGSRWLRRAIGVLATFLHRRSAALTALSPSVSGSRITNSSPPNLATITRDECNGLTFLFNFNRSVKRL